MAERTAALPTYRRLLSARVRSDWQYRASFVMLSVGQALTAVLDLVVILVVFEVVPALGGWPAGEVVLLYGFSATAFGLADVAFGGVEKVADHIREGSFDRFLLRPRSTVLLLATSEFALRRLSRVVPGVAALGVALARTEIEWTPGRVLLVPLTVVTGSVICASIWVLASSISFWMVGTKEVANSFTYGGGFAHQYPLHIYSEWVRGVIGWLMPMAFVAYVPVLALTGAANPLGLPGWLVVAMPVVAAGITVVARGIWLAGIRNYQGTGS